MSLQKIADMVGVGNRAVISEWINGNRKAENTSFANLMTYLERLGYDYRDYFPTPNPIIKRVGPDAPVEQITSENAKTIPVYAMAGAGPGIELVEYEPLFSEMFCAPDRKQAVLVSPAQSAENLNSAW